VAHSLQVQSFRRRGEGCLRRAFAFQQFIDPRQRQTALGTADDRSREQPYHLVEKAIAFETQSDERTAARDADRVYCPDRILARAPAIGGKCGEVVLADQLRGAGSEDIQVEVARPLPRPAALEPARD